MNDATMGVVGDQFNIETRKTKVTFADKGYWLEELYTQHAFKSNDVCKWDYDIDISENVQFAQYEVGHHYTWHTDTFTLSGAPRDRKITVVCLLNDEFEGGAFELRLYNDYRVPMEKGTMIAFPSILEHRVTPITRGVRYSATMWFNGPRFR